MEFSLRRPSFSPYFTLWMLETAIALGATYASIFFHCMLNPDNLLQGSIAFDKVLLASLLITGCLFLFGTYSKPLQLHVVKFPLWLKIFSAMVVAYLFLSVPYGLLPTAFLANGILLYNFITITFCIYSVRIVFAKTRFSKNYKPILMWGNNGLCRKIYQEMTNSRISSPRILCDTPLEKADSIETIIDFMKKQKPETIIVSHNNLKNELFCQFLQCYFRGYQLIDEAAFYESITGKVPLEYQNVKDYLFIYNAENFRVHRILKLLVDWLGSLGIMILTLPLQILVAIIIKLTSPGPVFYSQKRIGLHGKPFMVYKYRTMYSNSEERTGPVWATDEDNRTTWIGNYLRATHFDEIPQVFNVFKGEMSLIGPRPERPHFTKLLQQQMPHYFLRHSMRPGITGWAQVKYQYSNTVEGACEKLRYDLFYIKHFSLSLDILILLKTFKVVFTGKVD